MSLPRSLLPLPEKAEIQIPVGATLALKHGQDMHEPEPILKGQLLLDSGRLGGCFFHRAVVLVCYDGAKGTFGLVFNRASGTNVGGMLVPGLPETLKAYPLFVGGPVAPSALSFLRTEPFLPEAKRPSPPMRMREWQITRLQ